jgi:hypothetical protein
METGALAAALAAVAGPTPTRDRLAAIGAGDPSGALHVAVMRQPYLAYLLEGRKTIESRFSVNRVCPFESVRVGDVLALKVQSGPLVGVALVEHAAFYELDPNVWQTLQRRFARPLCAEDPQFWADRSAARYATLMRVRDPRPIPPLAVAKRDRRGWVRLSGAPAAQQALAL